MTVKDLNGASNAQAGATEATLDVTQIDCLLEIAGVEGVNDIIGAFWKSTDALLATMRIAIENGDGAEAARLAHALKGSAANVGAMALAATARAMEGGVKAGDFGAAKAAFHRSTAVYEETRSALCARVDAFDRKARKA
jgi:HPt (histidine-containing phosphotransfer) domain-containing protein